MLCGTERERSTAIAQISKRCKGFARKCQRRFGLDDQEIRDALTDALIDLDRIVRKPDFELLAKLTTLVHRFLEFKCINRLKQKSRRPASDPITEGFEVPDRRSVFKEIESLDMYRLVYKAMDALGKNCKELLVGTYVHGYPPKELAERCGLKNARVAISQKSRCLKKLRAQFPQENLNFNPH